MKTLTAAVALLATTACAADLSPAQRALAADPRFKYVTLVAGPHNTVALEGLVETETDAYDARMVVFKSVPHGTYSGVFIALMSKQPGMSRLGRPWAAVPGSADDWERLTRRRADQQIKPEWWQNATR